MSTIKNFIKDMRGGANSIQMLSTFIIIFTLTALVIDIMYVEMAYLELKTQMDMSNRAVYREIDTYQLAQRNFYIDESDGYDTFLEYLKYNMDLDDSLSPTEDNKLRIVEPIKIIGFEIYNETELPNTTPVGTPVDQVSVHSRIEVKIKPLFLWFGDVTLKPYMDTDLPSQLLRTFHP